MAVVENFTTLKANEQFSRLMDELSGTRTASQSNACATTVAVQATLHHIAAAVPRQPHQQDVWLKDCPFEAPPEASRSAQGQLLEQVASRTRDRPADTWRLYSPRAHASPGCPAWRLSSPPSQPPRLSRLPGAPGSALPATPGPQAFTPSQLRSDPRSTQGSSWKAHPGTKCHRALNVV